MRLGRVVFPLPEGPRIIEKRWRGMSKVMPLIADTPTSPALQTWQRGKDEQKLRLRVWFQEFEPGLAFLFLPLSLHVDDLIWSYHQAAFLHWGFRLMLQKNPESESVRDQQ